MKEVIEDEKYDGFYAAITRGVNMLNAKIIKSYHGLWEIVKSFKITKTDLKRQPIYLFLEQRIEAHFLTCYIALFILRFLCKRLIDKYSPEQIIKSLKNTGFVELKIKLLG